MVWSKDCPDVGLWILETCRSSLMGRRPKRLKDRELFIGCRQTLEEINQTYILSSNKSKEKLIW